MFYFLHFHTTVFLNRKWRETLWIYSTMHHGTTVLKILCHCGYFKAWASRHYCSTCTLCNNVLLSINLCEVLCSQICHLVDYNWNNRGALPLPLPVLTFLVSLSLWLSYREASTILSRVMLLTLSFEGMQAISFCITPLPAFFSLCLTSSYTLLFFDRQWVLCVYSWNRE